MPEFTTDLVVLGGGPGGYSAAFRAADLGKKVVLIERHEALGGVCLNVGCIPSKAFLHVAKLLDETKQFNNHGINFGTPEIDPTKLCAWKNSVIKRLTTGLKSLARQRKIELITGIGKFTSPQQIEIVTATATIKVNFTQAIIAVGSTAVKLPCMPADPRIIDSTDALNLTDIPQEMLIIGGGVIGLEMATIYSSLGSKVTIVELMDQLMPGADIDIVKSLQNYTAKKFAQILLQTKVTTVLAEATGLHVTFATKNGTNQTQRFDRVLVAVGRKPNGKLITAENAGVNVDPQGFIPITKSFQTSNANIYAIGDVVGNPMLAHKAVHEGRLAAEIIVGLNPHIPNKIYIPSVAYTDPELAFVGLSETAAQIQNISYAKGVFPWVANGRSLSLGRQEGITKLLFDPATKKILGGSIVGPNAGELIAEISLAITNGLTAEQIAHTIHPHPTLSETIPMAAEVFLGTVTDLFFPLKMAR